MNIVIILLIVGAAMLLTIACLVRFFPKQSNQALVHVRSKARLRYDSWKAKRSSEAEAKLEANPRSPTRGIGFTLPLIVVLALIALALIGWGLWSLVSGVSFGFSLGNTTGGIILLAIFAILDLVITGGVGTEKGIAFNWREKWMKVRVNIWFAFLWTTVIYVLNVVLKTLDSSAWTALWHFKNGGLNDGGWFFYFVMALLVLSMLLMVNVKIATVRVCGFILFILGMASWGTVWAVTTGIPSPRQMVLERFEAPGSSVHSARVLSLMPTPDEEPDEKVVLKGQSKEFVINEVVSMDDVHLKYRFDRRGKWIDRPRGQTWKHNPKRNVTYELMPVDSDLIVKVRR